LVFLFLCFLLRVFPPNAGFSDLIGTASAIGVLTTCALAGTGEGDFVPKGETIIEGDGGVFGEKIAGNILVAEAVADAIDDCFESP
jgi:hypothetical protein